MKVPCPLCDEQIHDNRLGEHFLSKKHKEDIIKKNPKLTTLLNCIGTDQPHDFKRCVPQLQITSKVSYDVCFCCKRCWKLEGSRGAPMEHYKKYPDCLTNIKGALESYLTPPAPKATNDPALLKKVELLEKELKNTKKELNLYHDHCDMQDQDIKTLQSLIDMMCGPNRDLERLKDILENHKERGIEGLYTKEFN